MSNRGQDHEAERVGDYLELERHLERLRQEQRPRRPRRMRPGQAKVYQMAALFRAAVPGAADPDPSFAARLEAQLEREWQGHRRWFHALLPARQHAGGVARRALLTNGLAAAAGLVAGAVLGGEIDQQISRQAQAALWRNAPLVGLGKEWIEVAPVTELVPGTMRQFRIETLVGYVFHNDHPTSSAHRQVEPEWMALSAACTHMGCILAWNSQDRLLHCPCHAGAFTRFGMPADPSQRYLRALPRMPVQIVAGQVWVQVPAGLSPTTPTGHPPGEVAETERGVPISKRVLLS